MFLKYCTTKQIRIWIAKDNNKKERKAVPAGLHLARSVGSSVRSQVMDNTVTAVIVSAWLPFC
jgi:hypothetical protein